MSSQTFIHFLLIAALSFSPLAANMHIVSHLHDCEDVSAAVSAECEHVDHQIDLTPDDVPSFDEHSETSSKFSAIDADCSIYHLYVGLSGCLAAAQSIFTLPANAVVNSVTTFDDIPTEAADRLRIRGPPILS